MTQKFQPRRQCIQPATGENLTEVAQIADRQEGYCKDLYHNEERKRNEQEYWEQEPRLHHFVQVARAICQTASRKATGPDEVPTELIKAEGESQYWTECTEYVWRSGKLVSGHRNGRSLRSSHFPRKVILNNVQITEQLLSSHMQARSFFGSYWKASE